METSQERIEVKISESVMQALVKQAIPGAELTMIAMYNSTLLLLKSVPYASWVEHCSLRANARYLRIPCSV